ncbi:MAG: AEC family transporter [Pseudomonadota bacterium]
MLTILTHDILPVFAMLALGFVLGRFRYVVDGEAKTLNRVAFLILQPALIFPLIAAIDLSSIRVEALALYVLCEVVAFAAAYALARYVFRREHLEAWLLAMAVVFVNSLLYIWPISYLIYGEEAALPITAIVAWDASASFAFFIISMELMAGDKATGGAARRVATNPVLIAITAGLVLNAVQVPIPEPILTAAGFAGAGAAPLTLFALGVILSGQPLTPTRTVVGITAMKLVAFPALVFGVLYVAGISGTWRDLFVLNAAGPSGAMSFALALLYGVRTDSIAPVIIWTSILSLLSLAALA